MQNEWNFFMNVKYCAVLLQDKTSAKNSPISLLPVRASTWKRNSWLALKILFSKRVLSLCLSQALQLLYFFYIFIKPSYIFQLFRFISYIFKILSFRLLPDKHLRILPIFGRITTYLCKRIVYLKISTWKVCFSTIRGKRSEFCWFEKKSI